MRLLKKKEKQDRVCECQSWKTHTAGRSRDLLRRRDERRRRKILLARGVLSANRDHLRRRRARGLLMRRFLVFKAPTVLREDKTPVRLSCSLCDAIGVKSCSAPLHPRCRRSENSSSTMVDDERGDKKPYFTVTGRLRLV